MTPELKQPSKWWTEVEPPAVTKGMARMWTTTVAGKLRVLRSVSTTSDGRKWVHISVSHPVRLPSWGEISEVKDEFIGEEAEAYQVMAKKSEHVNIADCLHLWSPLDGQRCVANLHDLINEVSA